MTKYRNINFHKFKQGHNETEASHNNALQLERKTDQMF